MINSVFSLSILLFEFAKGAKVFLLLSTLEANELEWNENNER